MEGRINATYKVTFIRLFAFRSTLKLTYKIE